jgi:hypothetical protein
VRWRRCAINNNVAAPNPRRSFAKSNANLIDAFLIEDDNISREQCRTDSLWINETNEMVVGEHRHCKITDDSF